MLDQDSWLLSQVALLAAVMRWYSLLSQTAWWRCASCLCSRSDFSVCGMFAPRYTNLLFCWQVQRRSCCHDKRQQLWPRFTENSLTDWSSPCTQHFLMQLDFATKDNILTDLTWKKETWNFVQVRPVQELHTFCSCCFSVDTVNFLLSLGRR